MNKIIPLFAIVLLITACQKTVTVQCTTPAIVLQPEGFSASEWDTVITTVYSSGFRPPMVADTFIAKNLTDELLIKPEGFYRDYAIYLPSTNSLYRVYGILVFENTVERRKKGEYSECYDRVSLSLDNERIDIPADKGRVIVKLKK